MAQLDVDLEGTGINLGPRPSMWASKTGTTCPAELHGSKGHKGILVDLDYASRPPVPSEIPVNTDAVKCSPLFEIRDSQTIIADNSVFQPKDYSNAPISTSTFGTYNNNNNNNIRIEVDSASYTNSLSQDPSQYQLPSRSKETPFQQRISMMDQLSNPAPSEMSFSTSSKSRSSSTFTPPASKNSPNGMDSSSSSVPTPNGGMSGGEADVMFFEMPDIVPDGGFQGYQAQLFTPFGGELAMGGSDWAGVGGSAGEGLAPLSESAWAEIMGEAGFLGQGGSG